MNICYIQARGGSKRFRGKNLAPIDGVPMLVAAIRKAKKTGLFDFVVVTSDDPQILQYAADEGVMPLWRTPLASSDDATDDDVAREVLRYFPKADNVCKLYPCSPLLTVADIQRLYDMYITGYRLGHYFVDTASRDAGEIYIFSMDEYRKHGTISLKTFPWKRVVKQECQDINTPEDLERAKLILSRRAQ